jgi:acyl-CoA reductase-like NAD-dependent aldehyde dehydrogenase
MKTIKTHYIDGAFVESHGREVMDIINPTNRKPIARLTLADEEDARRAIAAAKEAFVCFGQSAKQERLEILRNLHKAVSALHAYVSGTDLQRARRVASQIRAGRVAINGLLDDQQAPFGGFKHSGVGREFGTFGIEAYLEPRAILE